MWGIKFHHSPSTFLSSKAISVRLVGFSQHVPYASTSHHCGPINILIPNKSQQLFHACLHKLVGTSWITPGSVPLKQRASSGLFVLPFYFTVDQSQAAQLHVCFQASSTSDGIPKHMFLSKSSPRFSYRKQVWSPESLESPSPCT